MKSKLVLLCIPLGCALVGGFAIAGGLKNTPHDFSGSGWLSGDGERHHEMCLPCHSLHGGQSCLENKDEISGATSPVWKKALTSAGFRSCSNHVAAGGPGAKSMICLGCHDGQTAPDSFGGQYAPAEESTGTATTMLFNSTALHPVGIVYPATSVRDWFKWGTVTPDGRGNARVQSAAANSAGTPYACLYGTASQAVQYTVECESCHQVHDNTNGKFLRMANNDPSNPSALCVTCHKP